MHRRPTADKDYFVTFDVKNDALVLKQPIDYYIKSGLTYAADRDQPEDLGVKFESPQQGEFPRAASTAAGVISSRVVIRLDAPFGVRARYSAEATASSFIRPVRNSIRISREYPFTASTRKLYRRPPGADGLATLSSASGDRRPDSTARTLYSNSE